MKREIVLGLLCSSIAHYFENVMISVLVWNFEIGVKGAPIAKHFSSYVNFRIRCGSKRSPAKFQSDDVIVGSTGVKLVKISSLNFGQRVNTLREPS